MLLYHTEYPVHGAQLSSQGDSSQSGCWQMLAIRYIRYPKEDTSLVLGCWKEATAQEDGYSLPSAEDWPRWGLSEYSSADALSCSTIRPTNLVHVGINTLPKKRIRAIEGMCWQGPRISPCRLPSKDVASIENLMYGGKWFIFEDSAQFGGVCEMVLCPPYPPCL